MVRKGLTGVFAFMIPGCAEGADPDLAVIGSGFRVRADARPGMTDRRGARASGSVAVHLHAQYRAMLLDPKAAGDEVVAVHAPSEPSRDSSLFTPDSGQAWVRLGLALIIGSIGSVGMWSVVVVLPGVQAEFGATRGAVSLAFTLIMLGFGLGGVATGRITDRFGLVLAMALSISFLGIAYILAGLSTTLWQFIAVHFLIGLGTSATFAPLLAEGSPWFERAARA